MDEEYLKWLKTLKAGDEIAIEKKSFSGTYILAVTEITKVTAKGQIRVKWNDSYLFKDGVNDSKHSGIWTSIMKLLPTSLEVKARIKHQQQAEALNSFHDWGKLSAETTNKIYELIFPLEKQG